jgi:aarF domain-containing kinase
MILLCFQFNQNFDRRQWTDVGFPEPIFLSESVLIESFIPGKSVKLVTDSIRQEWETQPNSTEQLDAAHFIVTRGEDLYLKMLLQDGLMHSDLHPGKHFSMLECLSSSDAHITYQEI